MWTPYSTLYHVALTRARRAHTTPAHTSPAQPAPPGSAALSRTSAARRHSLVPPAGGDGWHSGVTGKCEADMCYEERVFFRLMSGIQSSITAAVLTRSLNDRKARPNRQRVRRNLTHRSLPSMRRVWLPCTHTLIQTLTHSHARSHTHKCTRARTHTHSPNVTHTLN